MITNVLEYLEDSAGRYPDKAAFVDDKYAMTFSALLKNAKSIGSYIAERCVHHAPIVVFMEKGACNIAAFMGVLYSGNFYCPIDVSMPALRIQLIVDTLKPIAILTDEASCPRLNDINFQGELILYHKAVCNGYQEEKLQLMRKKVLDTDPAYVLFTSGSTGIPKGVVISHRSIIDFTDWMSAKFDIQSTDSFGNQSPFFFDLSIGDVYCTLKRGCTNYIIPTELFTFPIKLLEYLNENKITIIFWVPSALCVVANLKALKKVKMQYLTKVLFCGEVMPVKQLNIWRNALPDALFVNLYGPCEAVDACTYYIVNREFADDEALPIGIPCENTDILVLNEDGQQVAEGEIGELCIRGTSLALGYYNNAQKTEDAFVQNPLNTSYPELIYKTGDLVKYNEYGELLYVSRKDFQIKHMGHRIELGEIETATGTIEAIESCACIYDTKIILCYTGCQIENDEIEDILKKKIPEYMMPAKIIYLNKFPYNANGKIDRIKLKDEYCAGRIG